ncbi:FG-GAP repeat domain-containing protein, partial [Pseudomonadota bacterium]
YGTTLADLDGDGDLDAFVANNGASRVWENVGSGMFTQASENSLGNADSRAVALGDMNNDGELDAFVANLSQSNRVWRNDSGTFIDTLNSLGGSASRDVALGDLDGDGDLDAIIANDSSELSRVWLNQLEADGGDGIPDSGDNCPNVLNPKQKDMDNDGDGNQCDPDTDGDGQLNVDDSDDDNDGLDDGPDGEGAFPRNSLDPDRDDDGIIDGLDPDPNAASNNAVCENADGPLVTVSFSQQVANEQTCAVTEKITTIVAASVQMPDGYLHFIAPTVEFGPGFFVEPGGRLSVISADPIAEIQNPPP